jgi:hypothetical protein
MEKSTETNGKIHSVGVRLLELFEAEASKIDPDMVAEFQKLPIEVRLKALLWATLQISNKNQPVSDWGGLA